jgi:CDP-diacylglycerol---serine O-phosphatidyltransferase
MTHDQDKQHGFGPDLLMSGDEDGPDDQGAEGPRRGFYILPNTITAASLMLGFYSITMSFGGFIDPKDGVDYFYRAAWAIFAAGIFDGLDGRIARLTKTTSPFGMQFDSLSDLVSFGLAPAMLVYNFALRWGYAGDHRGTGLGWVIAFMFVACGAMRLARFNVTTEKLPAGVFQGLSVPAAAGTLVFTVLLCMEMGCVTESGTALWYWPFMLLTGGAAVLMVSTFYYPSFKTVAIHKRHPFGTFLFVVLLLVVTFARPVQALFLVTMAYALSGPVVYLLYYRRHGFYPYGRELEDA